MLPILFSIGPIKIYSYGFFIAVAFLVATFLIWKLSRDEELVEEKILDGILIAVFFGILGARIFYIFLHPQVFSQNLIRTIHLIKFPGLAFHGGLILGTVAVIVFFIMNKLSVWQVGDIFVLGLCLGQAITRIGCFLNGCCYGIETKLPWGVYFPGLLGKRHPTQLYEAALNFLIFLFLFKIYKKTTILKKEKRGWVMLSYFIFTGISRFTLEILRGDSVYWRGIKIVQMVSGIIVIIALGVFIVRYWIEIKEWILNLSLKLKTKSVKPKLKAKS